MNLNENVPVAFLFFFDLRQISAMLLWPLQSQKAASISQASNVREKLEFQGYLRDIIFKNSKMLNGIDLQK